MKKKQIEEKPEVIIKQHNNEYFGSWHKKRDIVIGQHKYTVVGMVTGCGIGQIWGVTHMAADTTVTEQVLRDSLEEVKECGIGQLLATLGKSYYHKEARLFELGFKLLSEYPNYRHGFNGNAKQRLYALTL